MADDGEYTRKFSMKTVLGVFSDGNRKADKLVKTVLQAGFAGAAFLLVMHEWRIDRAEERKIRQQQHVEMVQVLKEQHHENVSERRRDRCVNAQLNDTVRAAIWRERPRPREECP